MRTLLRTAAVLCTLLAPSLAHGQQRAAARHLTTPREHFGHEIGADYRLPDYAQMVAYWRRLASQSDRIRVVDIGRTAEGRTQYMAVVSSPANLRTLDRWRGISSRLTHARGLTEAQARQLAREGRGVVWIDGGLHANEVLGAQQLIETTWQLVSREDAETRRFRDDLVVLLVHANPDGMDLVSHWYTREPDTLKRSTANLPRLYQKYVGHDDNRDFFASTQPETENMNRVMFREWYPQIVYNHHQTGPAGTVMFAPPFRDPFNYNFDPLIVTKLDLVGAAMHSRFVAEDKPGVVMRSGAPYSTWWNGGLRTITYFHNMVGLLTETIGNPTPIQIPFVADKQLPRADVPLPIAPQRWRFRQSIDYEVTANYAVLDVASRYRETFLYDAYRMGKDAIERGGRDTWTIHPSVLDSVRTVMAAERRAASPAGAGDEERGPAAPDSAASHRYWSLMHAPERRDPRAYVIPAGQADFPTATRFVNALLETGIDVERATASFSAGGKSYDEGSFVIRTAQPFRAHVLDMFEPQDHPNDFRYPGAPPTQPYDIAGWTLAMQMGVRFDRVLEAVDGPFERVAAWNLSAPEGRVPMPRWMPEGFLFSPRQNDAFTAVNRLLAAGLEVSRVDSVTDRYGMGRGSFYVRARGRPAFVSVDSLAHQLGVDFEPVSGGDAIASAHRLRQPRIALWDRYGGSIESGWIRWILEQYGYRYDVVYPPDLDAGNLRARYDVIVFADGAIPERDRPGRNGMPDPATIPAEYRGRIGTVTVETTVPRLREFMQQGGSVVTIGSSTVLARHLGLPVEDALAEPGPDGTRRPLPSEKFYIPGSLLSVRVDANRPAAWGMADSAIVMFTEDPAFRLGPGAEAAGVRGIAWYGARPLRSGWAWGQQYLDGAVAMAEADVGAGKLYLFGPEITFRAQPHGTFKLLFNALTESAAVQETTR
jgi:hypothetical protein